MIAAGPPVRWSPFSVGRIFRPGFASNAVTATLPSRRTFHPGVCAAIGTVTSAISATSNARRSITTLLLIRRSHERRFAELRLVDGHVELHILERERVAAVEPGERPLVGELHAVDLAIVLVVDLRRHLADLRRRVADRAQQES